MGRYAELLKDPRWQRCRLTVMHRAGWACEVCHNDKQTLHVHHAEYVRGRMPWEYPDAMLWCLCEDCHTEQHGDNPPRLKRLEYGRGQNRLQLAQKLLSSANPAIRLAAQNLIRSREIAHRLVDIDCLLLRVSDDERDQLFEERSELATEISVLGRPSWRAESSSAG